MNTFVFKATFIEATYFHYRKDKTTQTKQKTPKKPKKPQNKKPQKNTVHHQELWILILLTSYSNIWMSSITPTILQKT